MRKFEAARWCLASLVTLVLGVAPGRSEVPGLPDDSLDQGVNEVEWADAGRALAALLDNGRVDMVAVYRQGADGVWAYEIHARRPGGDALVRFVRTPQAGGWSYTVLEARGPDLLAQDDPRALATHEDELVTAGADGAIEPEEQAYPYLLERMAVAFDNPEAGDLIFFDKPAQGSGGGHGSMDVTQSRAPLILSGAGIAAAGSGPLRTVETLVRSVDIAPTLAALLGVERRAGATLNGQAADELYLRRQDGRVLSELLVPGARAERTLVLISDGMNPQLLRHLLERGEMPSVARLLARGLLAEYGTIVGFPSVTYPNHNTVGTGAYPAHHGIIGNHFYLRGKRAFADPIGEFLKTEHYLRPDVETLFEAVHRSFGSWHPVWRPREAYTASINDPCSRGALYATTELRFGGPDASHEPEAEAGFDPDTEILGARLADDAAVAQFRSLYSGRAHPAPKHAQVNLGLSDVTGHIHGPLASELPAYYREVDGRLGQMLDILEDEGLLEQTAIVFTADHGMENLRVSYDSRSPRSSLAQHGVHAKLNGENVYLQCLRIVLSGADFALGQPASTLLAVVDDDALQDGTRPPVPSARVKLYNGAEVLEATTDAGGQAALQFTPQADTLLFEVAHDAFNVATATVRVRMP